MSNPLHCVFESKIVRSFGLFFMFFAFLDDLIFAKWGNLYVSIPLFVCSSGYMIFVLVKSTCLFWKTTNPYITVRSLIAGFGFAFLWSFAPAHFHWDCKDDIMGLWAIITLLLYLFFSIVLPSTAKIINEEIDEERWLCR